jgi:apolipoprotein N-acyltransferase
MTTTELINQPRPSSPSEAWSHELHDARSSAPAEPTLGETVDETAPLVGVVPLYGPPVLILAVPWLLLALTLAGPFAVLVTVVVLLAAAAAVVALIGAVLAAPYLLARHVRAYWTVHAATRTRPAPVVARESRWGAA